MEINFEFDLLNPVIVIQAYEARNKLGENHKQDLPRLCEEKELRCFYKPATMTYVIIPGTLIELT